MTGASPRRGASAPRPERSQSPSICNRQRRFALQQTVQAVEVVDYAPVATALLDLEAPRLEA